MANTANGAKFVALSSALVMNGRRPHRWQTELTEKVAWCRRKTRTRPPQINPPKAPTQVLVIAHPMSIGSPNEARPINGNSPLMATRSGSLTKSGAHRSSSVAWAWKSHPM